MKLKSLSLTLLALPFAVPALADNPQSAVQNNIVSFNAEVEKEVSRDLLQVTLFYQAEGTSLSTLNKTINEKLSNALSIAKNESAVEIKDHFRHTSVRYNNQGKQSGWIDRVELVLESKDFQAISKVISELDGVMAVESTNALISSEKLMSLENELTQAALDKFKNKATLIQNSLNMKGYQILDLDVSSVNEQTMSPRPYMMAMAKSADMSAVDSSSDAYLENGKEKIKARISARIALRAE